LTLDRIEKEEAKLVSDEAERQRLLASGRMGRTSLLTGGFLGPGSTSRIARADTRAAERANQIRTAGRRKSVSPIKKKKAPIGPRNIQQQPNETSQQAQTRILSNFGALPGVVE
jgi:hypothetical protein